ncbi:PspC domain-containing protein [Egicoccus sp. AB-alg6-2]|uniref:PspC domain-containing protein n=1 Tax=Egicoccus sp. AB-alg6-2 TaxID=3242692 RepID=UPI00359F06C3
MSSSVPPPPAPPLRRRREGRLLAGVLAGLADHLGIDVAVARVLFVVLTLLTQGVFLVAYVLAWIFVPEETEEESRAPRPQRREQLGGRDPLFWVGVGTLIVGALWLIEGPFHGPGPFRVGADRSVLVPLVLIAVGVALWRAADRAPTPVHHTARPPETAMSSTDPSRADTVRIDGPGASWAGSGERAGDTHVLDPSPWSAPPSGPPPGRSGGGDDGRDWTPPPMPPSRSVLTRVTLGIAAVTVGVLWLLDVAGTLVMGPGRLVSAAMLVIGLGLLVGSVVGRGRGLIGVGLLLVPVLLVLQVLQPFPADVFGGNGQAVGTQVERPDDVSVLRESYQVGAGELRLDLSQITFTEDERVAVNVGFGQLHVIVPADVTVEVVGRVGAGELHLLDRTNDGVGLERTVVDEVEGSEARLTLAVAVGFGEANVTRAAAATPEDDGDRTTDTAPETAPDDEEGLS